MVSAWAAESACASDALDEASDVLGTDMRRLLWEGAAERLDETANAQPAILAASVAILRAAVDALPPAAFVAGHSMGEYSALVAAGSLPYPDALLLVRERGRLMTLAGTYAPGGMAAVLGLDDDVVEDVCAHTDGAQVANYNSPGQVVISGTKEGVKAASDTLRAAGAKRVVPLAVSIAAHSALMAPVAEEFAQIVRATALGPARPALVANSSAFPISSPAEIRQELADSLQLPVRWTESVRWLRDQGVTTFLEIGPGNVLTGLVRRILRGDDPDVAVRSLAEPATPVSAGEA